MKSQTTQNYAICIVWCADYDDASNSITVKLNKRQIVEVITRCHKTLVVSKVVAMLLLKHNTIQKFSSVVSKVDQKVYQESQIMKAWIEVRTAGTKSSSFTAATNITCSLPKCFLFNSGICKLRVDVA